MIIGILLFLILMTLIFGSDFAAGLIVLLIEAAKWLLVIAFWVVVVGFFVVVFSL
jgi:hypothetical protein